MHHEYHPAELLTVAEAAVSLGATLQRIHKWIESGRFPPPISVDGYSLHEKPVIPKDEVAYVAALMVSGKPWPVIEDEVSRLVTARASKLEWYLPPHMKEATKIGKKS
ncbi:helix-turn-helix domain-containing protein [Luminiphilus sp.]|nr:helix-turn-helix domain-containing protein [Luminiphilus sp.]